MSEQAAIVAPRVLALILCHYRPPVASRGTHTPLIFFCRVTFSACSRSSSPSRGLEAGLAVAPPPSFRPWFSCSSCSICVHSWRRKRRSEALRTPALGGTEVGRLRVGYLRELGHQRAVLQPEVLLLAVQLPLQHLVLAQQRLHFLQRPPTTQFTVSAATASKNAPSRSTCEQRSKEEEEGKKKLT